MNPNLQYGQMIRGPPSTGATKSGAQNGQFMGIVDARGFVSVWNSVAILKGLGSPAWTPALDSGLMSWAGDYETWLVQSDLGTKAAAAPK